MVPLGLPIENEIFPKFAESDWFQWIGKASADGTLEEVLGNLGTTILSVMKLVGLQNMVAVDRTWIRVYGAHSRTKEDCKGAIDFPLDFFTGKWARFYTGGPLDVESVRRSPRCLLTGYN